MSQTLQFRANRQIVDFLVFLTDFTSMLSSAWLTNSVTQTRQPQKNSMWEIQAEGLGPTLVTAVQMFQDLGYLWLGSNRKLAQSPSREVFLIFLIATPMTIQTLYVLLSTININEEISIMIQ